MIRGTSKNRGKAMRGRKRTRHRGKRGERGNHLHCGDLKKKNMHMHTLTLSDVVKGPLVVLEERVAFDLIHSSAAQTNLPAHSNRIKTVSRASSA